MSTSKQPPRRRHRPTPKAARARPTALLRTRFSPDQLLRQFLKLLPIAQLPGWLAAGPKVFYWRAFTPLITLWYCVFQRLADHHHLSHVVADAHAGGADRLSPKGKPLSRQLRSEATTSFSDARQRLPLAVFTQTLQHTAARIVAAFRPAPWFGYRVALLDGSTVRFRPFGDLPRQFPPHRPGNCKKEPYWCVGRVVALFDLATGVVLDTAIDSLRVSEQALSALLLQRSWKHWLLVADRNFGVFSVARAAVATHAQLLVRLTYARARKLARQIDRPLVPGLDACFTWAPSRQDQCPAGLDRTPVAGRLLAVRLARRGFRTLTLYLFTTLLDASSASAEKLARLYGQRWHVELYLRYVKTQMDLGFLECRSTDMAQKEWRAGLIAYNLIRAVMAGAAALAQVSVFVLSFSRTRELLRDWLDRQGDKRPTVGAWERLLARVAKVRLPKRRKPRPAEPRAIRSFLKHFPTLAGSRAVARQQLAATYAKS
jgi:putative transposase